MRNRTNPKDIIRDIAKAKYILRLYGYRPEQFGTGTKWNSVRLISRKK